MTPSDEEDLGTKIHELATSVIQLTESTQSLSSSIDRQEKILYGVPEEDKPGLFHRVLDLEKWRDAYVKNRSKLKWMCVSLIVSAAGLAVWEVFLLLAKADV